MKLQVTNCARCGNTHDAVEFVQFQRPVEFNTISSFEYWGLCPRTKEPILMHIEVEQAYSGPVYAPPKES